MAKIVILGSGVMGSALTVPAAAHESNQVTLVGSPLDNEIIASLQQSRHHPALNLALPNTVQAVSESALEDSVLREADVVVIGVSSPGIPWVVSRLQQAAARPSILALVTKGLMASTAEAPPLTYADTLPADLSQQADGLVGIGGPCIARELALCLPTRVTFASRLKASAERLRELFQTDYYRITTGTDIVGVEACAALKNFLCIGVSAMMSRYPLEQSHAKNPLAALFNQAVLELALLSNWLRQSSAQNKVPEGSDENDNSRGQQNAVNVAYDLAGMGDLHVTVGGGRNSRLGQYLGEGRLLSEIMTGPMFGVTAEGIDTGRQLSTGFRSACKRGQLKAEYFPLVHAILECIDHDAPFVFDFQSLPG